MIMFFKVLKALLKFILEIWLRDRTFRQFVRGNLSLIVTTLGFIIMSFMFTRVYFIALAHESTITEVTHKYAVREGGRSYNACASGKIRMVSRTVL